MSPGVTFISVNREARFGLSYALDRLCVCNKIYKCTVAPLFLFQMVCIYFVSKLIEQPH